MSESNELVVREQKGGLVMRSAAVHPFELADALFKSGYFKEVKAASQALAKVLAGVEFGIGPIASLQHIYAMDGKLSPSATLIAAIVKQTGRYRYRVLTHDDTACELEWLERVDGQWDVVGKSKFTIEEAKTAGLIGKGAWKTYPSDMLFARALTRGARRFAPDAFGGAPIYSPEELGADVDGEGQVIDMPESPAVVDKPSDLEAAKDKVKRLWTELRKKIGKDEADAAVPRMVIDLCDDEEAKVADLDDAGLDALAAAIEIALGADDDEVVVEADPVTGGDVRVFPVKGSKGADYAVSVYEDGTWDCSCPARVDDCKHVKGLRRPMPEGTGWLWPGDDGYDNAPTSDSKPAERVEQAERRAKQEAPAPVADEVETDGSPEATVDVESSMLEQMIGFGMESGLSRDQAFAVIAANGGVTDGISAQRAGLIRGALTSAARGDS